VSGQSCTRLPGLAGLRGVLRADEPMSRHTTWRLGGPARCYYEPADADDLAQLLRQLPPAEPLLWLGLGSNLLVRDGGLAGTVIVTGAALGALERVGEVGLWAGAGVACAKVARQARRAGLVGAEFLAGIPGTMGGALAMNAGAFGGETWELVGQVETIDRQGTRRRREPTDYRIGYREVRGPGGEWFLGALLTLRPGDGQAAAERIRALLDERARTQPTGLPSAGSVFRNPPGDKAGRLIDGCGLKGRRIGGAHVSDKHANFIITESGATAADVEALIAEIIAVVEREQGVRLRPEVRIVGEPGPAGPVMGVEP
jgi:UDP-N-acetylmuramate dehydrogenase